MSDERRQHMLDRWKCKKASCREENLTDERKLAVLRRNDLNVTALVTHRLSISNEIMLPYRYVTHETVKLQINYSSYRGTRAGRFYRPWDRWLAIRRQPASFCRSARFIKQNPFSSGAWNRRVSRRILLIAIESTGYVQSHVRISILFNDYWNRNTAKAVHSWLKMHDF